MGKDYFNRYVWLIDIINRHGYIKLDAINDAWKRSILNVEGTKIPERTFFNHTKAIQDMFGIEIRSERGLGYHISNRREIEHDGVRSWLLQSLSLTNVLNETSDMRSRIIFEHVPSSLPHLSELIQAMRDGHQINLTYQSFRNPESFTFPAQPYCLKMFKQRWYLLAKTPKYSFPTIYSLDRIKDVEELDEPFTMPADFNADEFFSKFYGIIIGEGTEASIVKVKVWDQQVEYFRTLPLHHSQKEIETTPEYTIFQYYLVPSYDFCQELLSNGDMVQVLYPSDLAEYLKKTISSMLSLYNS